MLDSELPRDKAGVPLAELQRWLRWAIAHAPQGQAAEPLPSCSILIAQHGVPDRERRIRAYSDAYLLRLIEAISIDFKGLHAVLGEGGLHRLVSEYLVAHPSRSPNVAELGRELPAFLRSHALAQLAPYLSDLAEVEWRLAEAYFADDVPPLDLTPLATLPPEDWAGARLELDPSVSWLETQWPVLRLRRLAYAERDVTSAIPHRRRAERLLVYRDLSGNSQLRRASAAELLTLARLRDNAPLGDITAALERTEGPAASAKIQAWFQSWVSDGLIRKVLLA